MECKTSLVFVSFLTDEGSEVMPVMSNTKAHASYKDKVSCTLKLKQQCGQQ